MARVTYEASNPVNSSNSSRSSCREGAGVGKVVCTELVKVMLIVSKPALPAEATTSRPVVESADADVAGPESFSNCRRQRQVVE